MTIDQRLKAVERMLSTAEDLEAAITDALRKGAHATDPDQPFGPIVELLQAAPEHIDTVSQLPARLICCATILAVETTPDSDELRSRLQELLEANEPNTTPNHIRNLLGILLEVYQNEPIDPTTRH
ncbi:MAG: hypothetical protein OXG35_21330 [Acidobacteria bacterium]|nr:hypothetical protein [Acidobacteriota bacterium]